jgi:hypothetical protein
LGKQRPALPDKALSTYAIDLKLDAWTLAYQFSLMIIFAVFASVVALKTKRHGNPETTAESPDCFCIAGQSDEWIRVISAALTLPATGEESIGGWLSFKTRRPPPLMGREEWGVRKDVNRRIFRGLRSPGCLGFARACNDDTL